jgi:hypothetical protein
LLTIRFEMENQFNKPKKKKKQLWEDVAKQMVSIGNYHVTGVICDYKFRIMMTAYRKCKDKLKTSGSGTGSKWAYFDIIDEHYGAKASVIPQPELIGSSQEEEKKDISENVEKKTEDEEKMYDLEYFKKKKKT